uniref:RZZ complex subunit KNTC1/ROD C-terminal domain-containing protein n=1 Tax=Ditylenchus dipsaci TaxID=166011 RepID=A0A915E7F6_9BILA
MPCPLHFRDVKLAEEACSRRSMAYFHNNQTYDVSTAVSITADQDLKPSDTGHSTNPKVLCVTKNKWFVLAVGSDIHAFDLSMGNLTSEHRSQASDHKCYFSLQDEQDQVIGLHFLPDGDVFVLMLSSGKVQLASLSYARAIEGRGVYKTMVVSVDEPQEVLPNMSNCSLAAIFDEQGKRNILSVLDSSTGIAYMLELPATSLRRKETELQLNQTKPDEKASEEKQIKLLYSTPKSIGCAFVVKTVFGFVYFPSQRGGITKSACVPYQNSRNWSFSDLFKVQEEVASVRSVGVHKVQLQFALDSSKETPTALDFEFLDVKEYSEFLEDVKLLCKVQTSTGTEFLIRSLDSPKVLLNVNCSDQLVIVPHSAPGDDSNIIYVDAFPKKKHNSILIRFVNEAQPSLRLKRLLDAGRYEEALVFARDADLSLDLVYSEVVRKHRDDIASAEDNYLDESFNEMLKYLAMLSDHEEACDSSSAILMMLKLKYEHIAAILKFTETKPIKAADIARFRYDLGTYRMLNLLQSPDTQTNFGKGSDWHNLFSTDEHRIDYFDELCRQGQVQQARILFTRYPIQITCHLNSLEVLDRLFAGFEQAIANSPSSHMAISEFLESELVELMLVTGAGNDQEEAMNRVGYRCEEIGGRLLRFLLSVTTMLERIQPTEFPENSLYFASTFKRALIVMQANSRSSDQHVTLLYLMKVMQIDSTDDSLPIGKLNTMIRHLKNLVKIYRTYQCPMSYKDYTGHTISSICHHILDTEHKLDRNEMLYDYIKKFAGVFYHAAGNATAHYNNAWDVLCLQITEHISDLDLRCRAVIEVASGATPPWSDQLTTVVEGLLAPSSKVDPKLKEKLTTERNRAELGQLFMDYTIPPCIRSRIMGATALKGLLQFIFKNSTREPLVKLFDAFKIVEVYEKLTNQQQLITKVECYYLYALVILQQQQKEEDEHQINLMEFFELVKTQEEKTTVAWKLVHYLKAMIKPTSIKKCKEQRIHWLNNLLCLLQRYLARFSATQQLVRKARNIRSLQLKYDVFVDFVMFESKTHCLAELQKFILDKSKTKSLIEVATFGTLLLLPIRDICCLIINLQIEDELAEASLTTLEFFMRKEQKANSKDLDTCLKTYSLALYHITSVAAFWGSEFDQLFHIVNLFKLTLPTAIDWATHQQSIRHSEAFCRISRYICLLESILKQCVSDRKSGLAASSTCSMMVGLSMVTRIDGEDGCSEGSGDNTAATKPFEGSSHANLLTNRRRVAAFLPAHEGAFFDSANIIASASAVASSVVEPPAERERFTEQELAKFVGEMRNQWLHLFGLLSSHTLLELHARQFAYSLPCFSDYPAETLTGRKQCVLELCKKIFGVAVADLPLAAHCLLSLSEKEIKLVLQELRATVNNGKSVRVILNLVRVAVFVILMIKDHSLRQQCVSWLETTLWQKKLTKLGMCVNANQLLKKEQINELMGEFIKVLIPPSVLHTFCVDRQIGYKKALMLSYATELCKASSSPAISKDKDKFNQTIETTRASLQVLEDDEENIKELVKALDDMCPTTTKLLIQKHTRSTETDKESEAVKKHTIWLRDRRMLIDFLKLAKRENGQIKYTEQEKKWYRAYYINPTKSMDASSLSATRNNTIGDESTLNESAHPGSYYTKIDSTECNFPAMAASRLPFHVFLIDSDDKIKNIIVPIILNEMNIYNASRWLALLSDTESILKYSRTMMLTPTINSAVQEAVKYNRQLPEYDLQQIQQLIHNCQNFLSCTPAILIKALLSKPKIGFKNLPLSPLKISILQMCLNIAQDCLRQQINKPTQDQKQIDEYQTLCADVQTALRHFKTELLLEQNCLLNNDIKEAHKLDLWSLFTTFAPTVLTGLMKTKLFVQFYININSQFCIVNEVAEINQVNLNDTYDTLILLWLPGSEAQMESAGGTHSDPDATIDFMGAAASNSLLTEGGQVEEDLAVPQLYNDPSLTRIVYLLRKCNDNDKARMIAHKFEQDASIVLGGYTTKIRIACCLLRYLSNEQMEELFDSGLDVFCENIAKFLNQRLLMNCRLDKSINEFEAIREDHDKITDFVRSILSPQSHYRQTQK